MGTEGSRFVILDDVNYVRLGIVMGDDWDDLLEVVMVGVSLDAKSTKVSDAGIATEDLGKFQCLGVVGNSDSANLR